VDGRIDYFTAANGHYHPGMAEIQQLTNELGRHGVTGVPVYGFDGKIRWIQNTAIQFRLLEYS
jgi:hypothetical protein